MSCFFHCLVDSREEDFSLEFFGWARDASVEEMKLAYSENTRCRNRFHNRTCCRRLNARFPDLRCGFRCCRTSSGLIWNADGALIADSLGCLSNPQTVTICCRCFCLEREKHTLINRGMEILLWLLKFCLTKSVEIIRQTAVLKGLRSASFRDLPYNS